MKKNLIILVAFQLFASCSNEVLIPDENFKNALLNESCAKFFNHEDGKVDLNNNGKIEIEEVEDVKALWLPSKEISSLKGIHFFKNIEYIDCSNNKLDSIDVEENLKLVFLSCGDNNLKDINVTKNSKLEFLGCSNNQILVLDVTKNTKIDMLFCNDNKLSVLKIGEKEKMDFIHCENNQLKSIDVNGVKRLNLLNYENNQLESLFFNDNLEKLSCDENPKLDCKSFGEVGFVQISH